MQSSILIKPSRNNKGQKIFSYTKKGVFFLQLAAEKKNIIFGAARKIFGPFYFVTALTVSFFTNQLISSFFIPFFQPYQLKLHYLLPIGPGYRARPMAITSIVSVQFCSTGDKTLEDVTQCWELWASHHPYKRYAKKLYIRSKTQFQATLEVIFSNLTTCS